MNRNKLGIDFACAKVGIGRDILFAVLTSCSPQLVNNYGGDSEEETARFGFLWKEDRE